MKGRRNFRAKEAEGRGTQGNSVGGSIGEVECNDPEKSLWEFRQEVTEDFLKSDFSGGERGAGQQRMEKDEWRGNEGSRLCLDFNY